MAPSGRHVPALERQPQSRSDQIFYYDEKYMQRRMDYSPQVTSRAPIAHYTHDHKTFVGFVFPTRRIAYRRDQHGIADQSLAVITLDLDDITVAGS